MSEKSLSIFWKDRRIGDILDPKVDNFDLYGKWRPSNSGSVSEFLDAVRSEGQAEVLVGSEDPPLRGVVEFTPSFEIEIKLSS